MLSSIYDVIDHPEGAKEGFPKIHTKLDYRAKFGPKWVTKRHFMAILDFLIESSQLCTSRGASTVLN